MSPNDILSSTVLFTLATLSNRHATILTIVCAFQVHFILRDLVRKSVGETQVRSKCQYVRRNILSPCLSSFSQLFFFALFLQADFCWQELKRFPTLQGELAAAAIESLEKFRDESKKTAIRLVEMESSYLTVDFFRKLPQEMEKGGNPGSSSMDRYTDGHLRRIGQYYRASISWT